MHEANLERATGPGVTVLGAALRPQGQYLEVHQTHPDPISPYERKLAGAVMEVFARGVTELSELTAGLNGMGLHAPDGGPWTEESFRAEMRRMEAGR